ncbi:ribosome hibernation-promoting factor, HPF/YfiA family [Knoellia subterranea]|uniref:Ribosome hibernation promoting factor n=1 Tax=Knoellia subterranea KCTC 19937 TaxID=1385521 RepID=A0A0A0JJP9_9MICO|nr:ribosome-associated translation inhibitor RaiA [Knoellia subterranea]KGN36984.1 30S ribosomal protein S30 [Knoellia subterranea KCTC 19937]
MDIVVTGRHTTVSDRFRQHIADKLDKVQQLAPRTRRIDVVISHEANRRQSKACDRVEITVHVKGPVIRAEACQEDKYAALDVALEKLLERLRRKHDRTVRRGRNPQESVAAATAFVPDGTGAPDAAADDDGGPFGDSPIEVREKVHTSAPMSLEQALREMELVGHDFYLFHDTETDKASVVYRRRGWSYGVLHLDLNGEVPHATEPEEGFDDREDPGPPASSVAERAEAS